MEDLIRFAKSGGVLTERRAGNGGRRYDGLKTVFGEELFGKIRNAKVCGAVVVESLLGHQLGYQSTSGDTQKKVSRAFNQFLFVCWLVDWKTTVLNQTFKKNIPRGVFYVTSGAVIWERLVCKK